jgi:hypothetical protein
MSEVHSPFVAFTALLMDLLEIRTTVLLLSRPRRGGRVVDCASLENWRAARSRGFESHPLRHLAQQDAPHRRRRTWDENTVRVPEGSASAASRCFTSSRSASRTAESIPHPPPFFASVPEATNGMPSNRIRKRRTRMQLVAALMVPASRHAAWPESNAGNVLRSFSEVGLPAHPWYCFRAGSYEWQANP